MARPEDLKTLIDEAHRRGLMVFLDVVYNHFGPEGNFLGRYAPTFFTDAHTPWGSAIDYRVPEVRAFAIENALYWLRDYRFDGLRLDAANHIFSEPGQPSMLHDLSIAAGRLATSSGRHIHLVLENGDNRASLLDAAQEPPRGKYRAQWNDDYHHAWHVLFTRESARAITAITSVHRAPTSHVRCRRASSTRAKPRPSAATDRAASRAEICRLRPSSISCRTMTRSAIVAFGDRLETLASATAIEAALAVTLLSPMIPMLFMGEEWGSKAPFPFFCDFEGDLADAVRHGRKQEYEWAYEKYGDEVPDPLEPSTLRVRRAGLADARHAAGHEAAGAGAGAAGHSPS